MQIAKISLWLCALVVGGTITLRAQDNPAQAAARQALEQKMRELDANPAAIAPAPAAVVAATPAAPAAVASVPAVEVAAVSTDAALSDNTVAMKPVNKKSQPVSKKKSPKTAEAKFAPANPPAVAATPVVGEPVAAATLPAVLSKAEKLQKLLAQYKADQITPEEYHTQRAAIVAEP
jgi:hypothetical protein